MPLWCEGILMQEYAYGSIYENKENIIFFNYWLSYAFFSYICRLNDARFIPLVRYSCKEH